MIKDDGEAVIPIAGEVSVLSVIHMRDSDVNQALSIVREYREEMLAHWKRINESDKSTGLTRREYEAAIKRGEERRRRRDSRHRCPL